MNSKQKRTWKLSRKAKDEIVRLYNEKLSTTQIAIRLNISQSAVYSVLKNRGILPKRKS